MNVWGKQKGAPGSTWRVWRDGVREGFHRKERLVEERLEMRRKIGDESSRGTKGHSKKNKDITRPTSESIGKNATTDYWAGQPEHKKGGLEGDSTTQRALSVLYLEPTAVPSRPSSELESGGQNKNTQIAISVQFCLPAISETTQ